MQRQKLRVAIYARVSTTDQTSDNQLVELRRYAKLSNWRVVNEFVDHAVSGGRSDRVEFRRLMDEAYQRKFDLVLFWSLDRFSREGVRPTLEYLHKLQDWGVQWKSFTEQHIDSAGPLSDIIISIMATFAKLERVKISDRTKASLNRLKENGTHVGRPRLDDARMAVMELREKGLSIRQIVAQAGVSKATVQRIIKEQSGPKTTKVITFRRRKSEA